MASIVVFVSGGVAMAVAIGLIYRYRSVQRVPALKLSLEQPRAERFALVAGRGSAYISGAMVAGLLVPGLGGRLMMRLLAATSPESAQGRVTDADEIVGEITLGGTVGLIIFVGLFGSMLGLAAFVLLRRYLPRRLILAGLVAAGVGGGLLARPSGLIDPDNHDFVILSPRWLAVAFGLVLIVVFGALLVVLSDQWASTWPPVTRSIRGALAAAPMVALVILGSLAGVPGLLIVATVAFAVFVRPQLNGGLMARTDAIGNPITRLAGAAGGAWVVVSAAEVLAV